MPPDPAMVFDEDDLEAFLAEKFRFTLVSPLDDIEGIPVSDFLIVMAAAKRMFSFSLYSILRWIVECKELALPGLSKTIKLIHDDVETHLEFMVLLLAHLKTKPERDRVLQAVTQAMQIEDRFALSATFSSQVLIRQTNKAA
ncbi:hypothetical protein CVT26_010562 [Gymnopilus dilepis]|uniref:Uncharacterized protein n=1 Tax=Gymnopilus dilepis TaxID=231916 RepID=A0A409WZB5_9AGAR|nr:hypothetical protein CVT26_010562 [Gymnopilus dilepis]